MIDDSDDDDDNCDDDHVEDKDMNVATHPEECRSAPTPNWPIFDLCLPEYKERDDNDDLIVDYDDDGDNQWLLIFEIIMMIFLDPYLICVCLWVQRKRW